MNLVQELRAELGSVVGSAESKAAVLLTSIEKKLAANTLIVAVAWAAGVLVGYVIGKFL